MEENEQEGAKEWGAEAWGELLIKLGPMDAASIAPAAPLSLQVVQLPPWLSEMVLVESPL